MSAKLPNSMMYGLGEHSKLRFRHEVNWHTYGIFSADNDPDVSAPFGKLKNTYRDAISRSIISMDIRVL